MSYKAQENKRSTAGVPLLSGEAEVRSFGGDAVYSTYVLLGINPMQYNLGYTFWKKPQTDFMQLIVLQNKKITYFC